MILPGISVRTYLYITTLAFSTSLTANLTVSEKIVRLGEDLLST